MKQEDKRQLWKALSLVSTIGLTFVSTCLVGLLLGRWVDEQLGSSPWGTVVGIVLGMISGMWAVAKQILAAK